MTEDWKQRLIVERDQLAERFHKLTEFLNTESGSAILQDDDRLLLREQQAVMQEYLSILNRRVERIIQSK